LYDFFLGFFLSEYSCPNYHYHHSSAYNSRILSLTEPFSGMSRLLETEALVIDRIFSVAEAPPTNSTVSSATLAPLPSRRRI
jgi:hypothetical protein